MPASGGQCDEIAREGVPKRELKCLVVSAWEPPLAASERLKRLDRLAQNINDAVDLRLGGDKWRGEQIDVAAYPGIQAAFTALFVELFSHLSRRIKRFLCGLVLDEFQPDHKAFTANIADLVERQQLL